MSFKAIIEADIKLFNQNIDKARKEMDKLEKSTTSNLSKIGNSFVSIGKKASILSAGLVAVGSKSFLMAADFEDALGATEQIFKDSADTVNSWAEGLDTSFGIAKKEALEYSNLMGSMLINIGNLTEREASRQSAKLIELTKDLTAMYGGTTQDAVRALTGALKGNNTMLDNYGMAVNEALIKSKALEMGLISGTGEMSLQAKQAATLALIWEQTGAAQGQAAREADGASGAMRALKTEITNLSTELGELLLPVITPMVSGLKNMIAGFRGLSPEVQKAIVTVGAITAAIGPLLVVTGKILKTLPLIKAALTALTGPIGLTVAAIAGAAALIISNWDEIKAYFTTGGGAEMFNAVKELAQTLWADLKRTFEDIKRVVVYVWDSLGSDLIKIIKNAVNIIVTVVETIVKTFKNVVQVLDGLFRLDFRTALDGLKNLFTDIFSGISRIVLNAVSTISSTLAGLFDLIGLNKWADGLRGFAEGLTPPIKAVTESVEDNKEAIEDNKRAIEETIQPTIELTKANDNLAKSQERVIENLKAMRLVIPKKEEYSLFNELFTQSGNDLILNPTIEPNIDPATLKSKMYEAVKSAMGDLSEGIRVITIDLSEMLSSSLADIFGGVATAIMEGDNVMAALGASLLGTLGGIMVDLGKMVIATGTAIEKVKKALTSLGGIGAIAAGAALIAIGSAFSAGARKLGNSMSGGGYSSAPSMANSSPSYGHSDYRGAYQDDFTVTFVQKGSDLVGVLNTAEQRRYRL